METNEVEQSNNKSNNIILHLAGMEEIKIYGRILNHKAPSVSES